MAQEGLSNEPKNFRFVAAPVPGFWGFVATKADDVLLSSNDFPVEGQTLYQDWSQCDPGRVQAGYGGYLYTGPAEAPAGYQGFYFGPINATPNTPSRVTEDFGNHPWPDVLYKLTWYRETQFNYSVPSTNGTNLGTTFANRYYERRIYKPGATEGTLFQTNEYFSAQIFTIPQWPTPVSTEIQWEFLGQKGSFVGLHPKITIESKLVGTTAYYSTGVVGVPSVAGKDQFFPATNFEDWSPYCIYDQQKFVGIGWHRIQKMVFPPPPPDIIKSI